MLTCLSRKNMQLKWARRIFRTGGVLLPEGGAGLCGADQQPAGGAGCSAGPRYPPRRGVHSCIFWFVHEPEWAARLCRHGRPVPRSAAYAHGPHRPGQYSTRAQFEFLERVCQAECNYAEKLNLRRQVRALILMRNRGTLTALEVLPTLFRLFHCQDKALRQLLFRHIIAGELCNENISTFAEVCRALK